MTEQPVEPDDARGPVAPADRDTDDTTNNEGDDDTGGAHTRRASETPEQFGQRHESGSGRAETQSF